MKKEMDYRPRGVCSRMIHIVTEDGIVTEVQFIGGCSGNTQGIARLVQGMSVEEVIRRLDGIDCGGKGTSCPAQLALALKQMAD